MEDFDSLNEKQLESLERGLSDLKNNRVITSNKFWKELLSNKEQQLLIDEAYENFIKSYTGKDDEIILPPFDYINDDGNLMSKNQFITNIKYDYWFSEKWGLKIDERELSLEERATIWNNTHNPAGNIFTHNQYDENNIPKRAISLRYNHKTITSYE
jgi:hypothetical protein